MASIAAIVFLLVLAMSVSAAGSASAGEQPERIDPGIRKHRMGTIVIHAPSGAQVKVEQVAHEFWFGTAISRRMFRDVDAPESKKYLEILKANFNSAVHENALKWYATQPAKDKVSYADADRMLQWCQDNGLRMRGHCIFWGMEKHVQGWVKELDNEQLLQALRRRAEEVPARYRGRILEYDVNNEMLHGDYYAARLGDDIRVKMFKWVHQADPEARLFVNDYRILNGGQADKYVQQIEQLLKAGAPVSGIGCQGHPHYDLDVAKAKAALDKLAKLGLPIRITEFNLPLRPAESDLDADEYQQKMARLLEEFYRMCFAHPAVDGILMWGFWEGALWRPEAALWKKDFTPTPAAQAYRKLIFGRWWTNWQGTAGADGVCQVPAFFGKHRVQVGQAQRVVELPKAAGSVTVRCKGDKPKDWTIENAQ